MTPDEIKQVIVDDDAAFVVTKRRCLDLLAQEGGATAQA